MICGSRRRADKVAEASRESEVQTFPPMRLRVVAAGLVVIAFCSGQVRPANANALTRATAAYARGDYIAAVNVLTPPALRGDANAQAFLGFMYENGFGAPQAYDAAADLYIQAAIRGNAFAQSMLGLILAYKWLNLAAARTSKRERDYYLRLRNAVASKMSP